MATRTTDWTGSDGTTWPLSSGSWTHTTDVATVGSPTHVINTNQGRARVQGATTTSARRSHHADYTNFKSNSGEIRVYVASRVQGTMWVSLFLKTQGTGALSDRYVARFGGTTDKGFVNINKWTGGGETTLISQASTLSDDAPPFWVAFRATQRGSDVLLQAKIWSGTEPAWAETTGDNNAVITDSTSGLWDANGGFGIGEFYNYDPGNNDDTFYDDLTASDFQAIAPSSISSTVAFGTPTVSTTGAQTINATSIESTNAFGTPSLSGLYTISPASITSTIDLGTPTITSVVTIMPTSITTTNTIGTPSVTPGVVTILVTSITTTNTFGVPTVVTNTTGDLDANPVTFTVRERVRWTIAEGARLDLRERARNTVRETF